LLYVIITYLFSPILSLLARARKKITVSRILVIQTAKIGDLVCSTPVMREIKKKYPKASLTMIVNPATKELVEVNPYVDQIITLAAKDYRGLTGKLKLSFLIRKGRYDIGICLNPNVPFAVALFWGSVPVRISIRPNFSGFTFNLASFFFTYLEKHVQGRLITETYLRMLRSVGIENTDISKEAYAAEGSEMIVGNIIGDVAKPLIGIAVSCANKLKELDKETIATLINTLLKELPASVVFIGSRHDMSAADAILRYIDRKEDVINATGTLSLKELPALLKRLSLFIGVDTGTVYMADALSVPIIHLAGPIDTSEQRPVGEKVEIIQTKLPCVPCTYVYKTATKCRLGSRECIRCINIREVVRNAKRLVALPHLS